MDSSQSFGLAHLWAQSDSIIRAVALILLLMSITSWYLILSRAWRQLRARGHARAVETFWAAPDLESGLRTLQDRAAGSPFDALAQQARRRGRARPPSHPRQHAGGHARRR